VRLTVADKRPPALFIATGDYNESEIPRGAGFTWNRADRRWETRDTAAAEKLLPHADRHARALLKSAATTRRDAIQLSRAASASIEIPVPAGLEYLPFQRAGIAYASGRPNCLIADEMGLGKTIQAIGVINLDRGIRSVLVICPASLKINWQRELERWLARPLRVAIANGTLAPEATNVWITNYDMLGKHREALRSQTWDLLIADECHYLKNPKAQRTQEVLGKAARDPEERLAPIPARRRLFLTGTPIVNRPIELWPILRAVDRAGLGRNWREYVLRYCAGHEGRWGWEVSGASHLDELQERLRAAVMVRRRKADVLTELPAKRRQVLEVPAADCAALVNAENAAYAAQAEQLTHLKQAVERSRASADPAEYAQAVAALREGAVRAFADIARARHATALAKVPAVGAHLVECLEAGGKLVVFAHHHDVIAGIRESLAGIRSVVLTGETSPSDRQAAADAFQRDPACRVFIGSIGAAGLGLTLTASAHVVFAELDWVPGAMTQAEDRCHRIGQTESVLVQHLVLDGSLDARIAHTLVAKQDVLDRALDRQSPERDEPVLPGNAEPFSLATLAEWG
jgi:SWI/SNF-related matrix-associated actin-dependent regulator of chromatin subfamily A-like protein 1